MLRRLCPALVGVLLLGACTSGPDPEAEPSAAPSHAAGVRDGVAALYAGEDDLSPEEVDESTCFADALLRRLAPGDLEAAGIVTDGAVATVLPVLDETTARAWVAAQGECVDFVEVSTRALGAQSKGRVDAASYAGCLRAALSADELDAAQVSTLTGRFDTPEVTALAQAQADCAREAAPPE